MDPSLRNTESLKAHINKLIQNLIKHFENLVESASIEKTDYNTTSLNALNMQDETAALIRASEDLQILIRHMQELWLFGTVDTLAKPSEHSQSENDALRIAEMLQGLVRREEVGVEHKDGNGVVNGSV